jgi:hypothetical protein
MHLSRKGRFARPFAAKLAFDAILAAARYGADVVVLMFAEDEAASTAITARSFLAVIVIS